MSGISLQEEASEAGWFGFCGRPGRPTWPPPGKTWPGAAPSAR